MKLTPEHIESQIAVCRYISRDTYEALGTLTLCVLDMKNGTKVVGQSACLDESTFDTFTGRSLARANAVNRVRELEGYAAASQRANELTLLDGEVATSTRDAYDAGHCRGFRYGYHAGKPSVSSHRPTLP